MKNAWTTMFWCGLCLWAMVANATVAKPSEAYETAHQQFESQNYAASLPTLRELANQGHAQAQYTLGYAYHYGLGVEENSSVARQWFEKAAKQGNADAQAVLQLLEPPLSGLAVKGNGEENIFAPLFTESTIAVMQVNFADLSPGNIKAFSVDAGAQFLEALGFDDQSKKETLREFSAELDKFITPAAPLFAVLTQQLGITEFAVIADMQLLQQEVPAIIAVPWQDKTPADVDAFNGFLKKVTRLLQGEDYDGEPLDAIVVTDDFILIPLVDAYTEEVKETLQSWRANLQPSTEAKIVKALAALPNNEVKIAVTIPDDARKILLAMPPHPDFPKELQGLLMFAQQKIEWANASFNILKETSSDVLLTVKTATESDAVQMRALLGMGLDLGMNMAQFMAAQDANSTPPLPPIAFTFLKGWLRTFIPEVEGDKLIFKNRMRLDKLTVSAVPAVIGASAAFLLPAIQAAREAARRDVAKLYIESIASALEHYELNIGSFPSTEQGLRALIICPADVPDTSKWDGPYLKETTPDLDPWNNPYQYLFPGQRASSGFDLWSFGPDGVDGTDDDIGNWL